MNMKMRRVSRAAYSAARAAASDVNRRMVGALTPVEDMAPGDAYLSANGLSGYVLAGDELIGVFSAERAGSALVADALARGARRLDCFDGFLVGFYERAGFSVTRREANWTPGGPDVVYMESRS